MRLAAQTSIRRLSGALVLGLPLLLWACSEQPTSPLPSDPVLEIAADGNLAYSELVTQCLLDARERLFMEFQRHRTAAVACNGDGNCLAAEEDLFEGLVQEIRREYIDCRRLGR